MGVRCLKNGGFPATKQQSEKKYLISGNLFVLEVLSETSGLVSMSLTLALLWICKCHALFDVRHRGNRFLCADLGTPSESGDAAHLLQVDCIMHGAHLLIAYLLNVKSSSN